MKLANESRENIYTYSEEYLTLVNKPEFVEVSEEYKNKLQSMNLIDFSGLLSNTLNLIQEHQIVKDYLKNRFQYIHVDECQDTNECQFEILRQIVNEDRNIMMVGDISQSIYRFRGAQYKNVIKFLNDNTDCKRYDLHVNYRSTPQIVKVANDLIIQNKSHIATKFEAIKKDGEEIIVKKCNDQFSEAEFVANYIKRLIGNGKWKGSDIAVLYRLNAMSDNIERELTSKQVKYKIVGSRSFYDRKEIKDAIAFLKFYSNKKDAISFNRLSHLIKGVGDVTIGEIENISRIHNVDILESIRIYCSLHKETKTTQALETFITNIDEIPLEISTYEKFDMFLKKFNYSDFLELYNTDSYEERWQNVQEFHNSIGSFFNENPNSTIDYFLQSISLVGESNSKDNNIDNVTLMTIHAAKGLEFPIVFMIGMNDGTLPHFKAVSSGKIEEIEEERRLCYVGMTRAKTLLIMTYNTYKIVYGKGGQRQIKSSPSQFLDVSILDK
jgi:DNA helicase-2/ATP-dependent DNA helicase PcrA